MIYLHDDGIAGKKVRKTPSWATTSAFYCCAPTKLHEQICIFCATLKTFSLQAEITALGKLLKNAKFGANFTELWVDSWNMAMVADSLVPRA